MKKLFLLAMIVTVMLTSCKKEEEVEFVPKDVNKEVKELFCNFPAQSYQYYDQITHQYYDVAYSKCTTTQNYICPVDEDDKDAIPEYTLGYEYNVGSYQCKIIASDCSLDGPATIDFSFPTPDSKINLTMNCDDKGVLDYESYEILDTLIVNSDIYTNVYQFISKEQNTDIYISVAPKVGVILVQGGSPYKIIKLIK